MQWSHTRNSDVTDFGRALANGFRTSFDIREAVGHLSEPLELARHGIDINEYIRFREVAPHAVWMIGAKEPKFFGTARDGTPSQEDAMFCIEFAATALVQLERALGTVQGVKES